MQVKWIFSVKSNSIQGIIYLRFFAYKQSIKRKKTLTKNEWKASEALQSEK